ncbi:MAG TPA: stage II sporulation protein M, partial [Thiothrix sp.]|nr:stage II sporulation protein M [Thiothrix sp.]
HSAMELTAIVIAGTSGLKIAAALIAPQRKTRGRALLDNSKIAVKLIYGAALMFILAAFIEAFWSSLATIPVIIKYMVGLSFWGLVISYFIFAGRHHYAA